MVPSDAPVNVPNVIMIRSAAFVTDRPTDKTTLLSL